MSDNRVNITEYFKGRFITDPVTIRQRFEKIRAYVFDWDGVFNNGEKGEGGSSPFNEIDSMGTNLLRFNHYLRTGELPVFVIISGESNKAAQTLARRERFHVVYSGIKHKIEALEHLCKAYDMQPAEIAFMFDDVLDLSVAAKTTVRVMVGRQCNPILTDYAIRNELVDYITANTGGANAVREMTELAIGMNGMENETLEHRISFSQQYQDYLQLRQKSEPLFYTSKDSKITEQIL